MVTNTIQPKKVEIAELGKTASGRARGAGPHPQEGQSHFGEVDCNSS